MTETLPPPNCLADEELVALALGHADEQSLPRLQAHLEICPRCIERLGRCRPHDPLLTAAQDAGAGQAAMWLLEQPARDLIQRLQAAGPPEKGASPNDQIDFSCVRPGGQATLLQATASVQADGDSAIATWLAGKSRAENRYIIDQEIARGGMGAVVRAVDCDIRREVAIKFMLDETDDDKKVRFVEEAQITGQLEHPNIVPIHELGLDANKRLFFTMKLVNGRSLAEILNGLKDNPQREEQAWPMSRLLNIIVSICHALAYAHSRGVIHRDLKPANIMVGDFGEVYVMDWGLAKVVGQASSGGPVGHASVGHLPPTAGTSSLLPDCKQNIITSRVTSSKLTHNGAVIGTPIYMSPEQSRGEPLDSRSDIYSIGAILYEFLTLLPPVEKDGGHVAIMLRVGEGQIKPPAERAKQRAKQGKIPKELAAIALKALALKPADRYPTCDAIRQDIERYQEGWSVSAKQDTAVELLQKLIKRNKGTSIAIATAAMILLSFASIFLKLNRDARLLAEAHQRTAEREKGVAETQKQRAEEQKQLAESAQAETQKAYSEFQREQRAKEQVIQRSIPAMLRAARQLANEGKISEAAEQVALALTYAPNDPAVRLLKGQILLSQQNWQGTRAELQFHEQHHPDHPVANSMRAQLPDDEPPNTNRRIALANILKEAQLPGLAIPLLATVRIDAEQRKPLVALYQQQIEAAWTGLGKEVKLAENGEISLNLLPGAKQITDLNPLRGMQFDSLNLSQCDRISDLSPLQAMPLKRLYLDGNMLVTELGPLHGMPLEEVSIRSCEKIRDLSPLSGMKIRKLTIYGGRSISNISALRGMPLVELQLSSAPISDISPLIGAPLQKLSLGGCNTLTDISPLADMKLRELDLSQCKQPDLNILRQMPLEMLKLDGCGLSNIEPLQGMPLVFLSLYFNGKLTDITPLRAIRLQQLHLSGTKVTDLSPLEGMNLTFIQMPPVQKIEKGIQILRGMKSLAKISLSSAGGDEYTPAEFWRRYDAGEFNEKK